MVRLLAYIDEGGKTPFAEWFNRLDPAAAAKVASALTRMELGNFGNVKRLSGAAGVLEYRIDFGPGYRIYFGRDGDSIVILVGGGTKRSQTSDIAAARRCWEQYKKRKQSEVN